MQAPFSYNNPANAVQTATGFYHPPPTSGFHLPHQYPHQPSSVPTLANLENGSTAFTNVISSSSSRGYHQQSTNGTMQNQLNPYQQLAEQRRMTNTDGDEDDLQSLDSASESRTPTQSDQQISGPMQNRKRRRGVIEKRRRDRINSSLVELRRLVPAAFEKQGSQKLEKAEILQMTVDHLRFLNSKGIDALWRDQQRYATEYYSMGFRVCIGEVDTFLSKEGMDMQDPLRLRLMSHLQCVGVQRQSAFNVWTNTTHQSGHPAQNGQNTYWPATATNTTSPANSAPGLQYAVYGVLPPAPNEMVYSSQTISAVASSNNNQEFKNGSGQASCMGFAPTTTQANNNGSGY